MTTIYELWDTSTNNLVEACESQADALVFVSAYVAEHGPVYPAAWALLRDDDAADEAVQIAEGPALLALAEATTTATNRTPD